MSTGLLQRIATIRDAAPAARRAIFGLILDDPERVLAEGFDLLAERASSSVPTVMRACRDLGFAGLREFKLALARELALGSSTLHRTVHISDSAADVVTNIVRSSVASVASLETQIDIAVLEHAATVIASAKHIDLFGAGAASSFLAQNLQSKLFRLGLKANAWSDYHLQQVAAAAQTPEGVVIAFSHVGGMPTLLDVVEIARGRGAKTIAMTRPGTELADRADIVLGLNVPDDPVMYVGVDANLTHLTMIEILNVLVAQRLGEPAVQRLQSLRHALQAHGVDFRTRPPQTWDAEGVYCNPQNESKE